MGERLLDIQFSVCGNHSLIDEVLMVSEFVRYWSREMVGIKEFIVARNIEFIEENIFYQLDTIEDISSKQGIVLIDKEKEELFYGQEAIEIIKNELVDGIDTEKFFLEKYELFTQETFLDRKIVAGDKFVYRLPNNFKILIQEAKEALLDGIRNKLLNQNYESNYGTNRARDEIFLEAKEGGEIVWREKKVKDLFLEANAFPYKLSEPDIENYSDDYSLYQPWYLTIDSEAKCQYWEGDMLAALLISISIPLDHDPQKVDTEFQCIC